MTKRWTKYLEDRNIRLSDKIDIESLEATIDFATPWQEIISWAEKHKESAKKKSFEDVKKTYLRQKQSDQYSVENSIRQNTQSFMSIEGNFYNKFNTSKLDWGMNPDDQEILKNFIGQSAFETLKMKKETSLVRLLRYDPGNFLPIHTDSFVEHEQVFGKHDNLVRWFVAVNPWDWGHIFQVHNHVCFGYESGYCVKIHPNTFHLSANCGIIPKYTFTISGPLYE